MNIRNTMQSNKGMEEIVQGVLHSNGTFVRYLDSVEPFVREELAAFAEEAGFVGVITSYSIHYTKLYEI